MVTNPLVSIVTPSYNKGSFIEETILSVKNQTYPHIEHIVIDGGSTDETLDILRKHNDIITWKSEPDKGQADAINKGWRMAKGEIIAYLNADDTYTPWAVETAVKYLNEHPDVYMVYGRCNLIDDYGAVKGRYQARRFNLADVLSGRCMIPQPTVFLRKQVIDTIGYLDVNLYMAMDLDLWIRIGLKFKIEYIPELLANFRVCSGTKSTDEASKFGPDLFFILDKLFSDPSLPKEVKALKRRAYAGTHLLMATTCRGARRAAVRHCLKAIQYHPQTFLAAFFRRNAVKAAFPVILPSRSTKR